MNASSKRAGLTLKVDPAARMFGKALQGIFQAKSSRHPKAKLEEGKDLLFQCQPIASVTNCWEDKENFWDDHYLPLDDDKSSFATFDPPTIFSVYIPPPTESFICDSETSEKENHSSNNTSLEVFGPVTLHSNVLNSCDSSYKPLAENVPTRNMNDGCRGCEEESEKLYRSDGHKRFKSALPDYQHLDVLIFKSNYGFVDSHCHLDFLFKREDFQGTLSEYRVKKSKTFPASYEGCIAVFCKPHTFSKKLMWSKHLADKNVWGAFGCHPHNSKFYTDKIETELCVALDHPKVRALGEVGLDYSNRNDCLKVTQHDVFRRQLKIALRKKLHLVIHCRDANEDCMKIMQEILPQDHVIHLHCFTDNWAWAEKWMKAFPNLYIGLTNLVTFPSAEDTHEVARKIPLNRLLLETDAPYFIPKMSPKGTKVSHPGMAVYVAAQVATLRSVPLEDVLFNARSNTWKV